MLVRPALWIVGVALALVPGDRRDHTVAPAGIAAVGPELAAAAPARSAAVAAPALAEAPIAAWIIDGAGGPIAGVSVAVHDAGGATVATAISDAAGAVRIAARTDGDLTWSLDAPHVFAAELPWRTGEPPPRILLARRAAVEARVVEAGAPVAGAEVRLTDGSRPVLAIAITDADGVARFDDLVPGPYELWAGRGTTASPLARVDIGRSGAAAAGETATAPATATEAATATAPAAAAATATDTAAATATATATATEAAPAAATATATATATEAAPAAATAAAAATAPAPDTATAIELTLVPAGRVAGAIEAAPAGATVELVPVDVDHAVRTAPVGADGTFSIDGVPFGRWRLAITAPGFLTEDRAVELGATAPRADVRVALRRAGVVTGTVVDATGAPIEGAAIVLRAHGPGAATAPPLDDHRTVASARPLRWVHPLAPEPRTGERQMPIRDTRRFGAVRPGVRPAECGQGHCGVDLGVDRGSVVHAAADGTIAAAFTEIRHEAGRYVAIDHGDGIKTYYMHLDELRADLEVGQTVRAGEPLGTLGSTGFAKPNPHLHFAISQEQGGRTWYVDPEPILAHAVVLPAARSLDRPDAMPDAVIATLRRGGAGASSPSAPAAAAPAGSLPGASSPTGAAAPSTRTSSSSPAGSSPPATAYTAASSLRLTTDAAGRFRVDGVVPGTYVAVAFDPALAPGLSAPFAVALGGETAGIVVTLRPGVVVRGRVLGRDGPVRGARVVAGEGAGETAHQVATTYANNDGEFVLRSLAGAVTLSVTAPGFGDVERPIEIVPTDAAHREDFELVREDAALHGVVLAPDGGAAVGAEVRVVAGPTLRRRAVTDATGRFAIDRVAAGSYVLAVASAESPARRVTVDADAWPEIRLAQGGAIRVELRDAHTGMPLVGIRIEATGPEHRAVTRATDAAGTVELRGLSPGAWTVRARAPGYVATERVVEVRADPTAEAARLELARGAILAGVVRDRYGDRVADARVSLGSASTRTDADGRFRLVDVPTGAGRLAAERDGARGELGLDLSPGDELVTLSVDLAAAP